MSDVATPEPADGVWPESLIGRLRDLSEALGRFDTTDASAEGLTAAAVRLIGAARDVTAAARPVLTGAGTLAAALRDAAAHRRGLLAGCDVCWNDPEGSCGEHRTEPAQALEYEWLSRHMFGPPFRF